MNKKKMIPLLALAAVVVVLAAALLLLQNTGDSGKAAAGVPLCDFDGAAVTTLRYRDASGEEPEEVSLTRTDGTWTLDSDPELPIDQSKAEAIAENLAGLTAVRDLGEDADVDSMGFEEPTYEFELTAGEDSWNLTVGGKNAMTNTWYVRKSEEGPVYTVSLSDLSGLCKTTRQLYAAQEITDLTVEDVTVMTVKVGKDTLRFEQQDGTWVLTDDPGYTLDQSAVKKMASTICDLTTRWTVTRPGEDTDYGLDAPNAIVTLVGPTDSVQCFFGNVDPGDDSLCYLRVSGQQDVVYEVDVETLSAFACDKDSLKGATQETAEDSDVIAEAPVGGADDFADAQ